MNIQPLMESHDSCGVRSKASRGSRISLSVEKHWEPQFLSSEPFLFPSRGSDVPRGQRRIRSQSYGPTPFEGGRPYAPGTKRRGCGIALYGFSPCQWCTCERCGNDLQDGFCALCNSRNSCIYDPNPNSFDYPPDSYHPPHPTYETYSGDSCGNDSNFGTDCPPRFPLNYEPEPGYIQNYNFYPHDSLSFPQQYLCCDNCGGLHETFQCQSMNQDFYNSNSSSFDQSQIPQFPVIHLPPQETSIEILHDQENEINSVETFLRKFNRYSFFETPKDTQELFRELFNNVQNIHEELTEYINTLGWNRPAFCNNGHDDDEDCTIAVTLDFPITDSLKMENEHLDTISETESDEFIKSSVENLVSIPSESEDFFDIENECDMPDCDDSQTTNFLTFSNPLFDDSTSSNDESSHEEVIHEISFKTYSNPLFDLDEEIISSEFNPIHNEDLDSTSKNNRSDTDSYLLESSLNRDTLMIYSLKIDSLLAEFAGELIFLESIPPGVDETNCDPEEYIHLIERLLYDNSFPQFVSKNSNANIESFFPSPIPNEDSDSFMEEIDLFLTPDDSMPLIIEDDDDDSERGILIFEELLSNYSISLPVNESFYFDIPLFSRPPAKPPDGNTRILNIKMMGDNSDQKYSWKFKDSCQRILSSKSSFPQLHLGIILLHRAGSQPMLKSSYKAEDGVIISILPLVGGVADLVVEIKGTVFGNALLTLFGSEGSGEVGRSSSPAHFECYYSRINYGEVRAALRKMGRNKAVGPDQIPIEAWRGLGDEGVKWLTCLFNKIFSSAKMPDE
nr:hypothetical protein [Tanacetum cinerariifolium]